jgi:uncharacterized protein GlcG (DUF336 family)
MPGLVLSEAQHLLDAGATRARSIGQPMNIAVVDAGAHLLAFVRMDGAILASIDISVRKAATAVLMNMPTSDLYELAQPGAPLYGIEATNGHLVLFGGGIPLVRDDELIGAVGVSGGSVEQDVDVARAALGAL